MVVGTGLKAIRRYLAMRVLLHHGAGLDPQTVKAPGHADSFDVAISFTARDPAAAELAAELFTQLSRLGLHVFYYADMERAAAALGERLGELLPAIYRDRSRFVVMVGSQHYGQTHWTRREFASAPERPEDDEGRKRIAFISADGSTPTGLPEDLLHLGFARDGPETVSQAAQLIALRCGVRPGIWRNAWPWLLATFAGIPVLLQWALPGVEPGLKGWITGLGGVALVLCLTFAWIPVAWMSRRRAAVGNRLVVVTEGPGLGQFRRVSTLTGVLLALMVLAVMALCLWTLVEARLLVRDVRTLAQEGAPAEAMRRLSGLLPRLEPFRSDLIPYFQASIQSQLSGSGWIQFPGLYAPFQTLAGPSKLLEDEFYRATGCAQLQEGDDVLDHLQVATLLRPLAPETAQRLFETSLARILEWQMSGNEFYYGYSGTRAWFVYSQLAKADGRDDWLKAHRIPRLENNPGLAPRIEVHWASRGDAQAVSNVLAWISSARPEGALIDELARAPVADPPRGDIAVALRAAWKPLHSDERPHPEGFNLAAAYATQAPAEAEEFLVDRSVQSPSEQERAHALSGLRLLLDRNQVRNPARVETVLREAQDRTSNLEQWAARGKQSKPTSVRGPCRDLETDLRIFLETNPAQNRVPAGVVPPSVVPSPDLDAVARTLAAYLAACGRNVDRNLVEAVRERIGDRPVPQALQSFPELKARYQDAARDVPGAASDPGVLELVQLLRQMGETGSPEAISFLESIFPNLPHGNMTLAAAEGLLHLRGRFGSEPLARLRELMAMNSSIYRSEALEIILGNADRIQDSAERAAILQTASLVSVTGNSEERGRMLDVLAVLDPQLTLRRAFFLTVSSNTDDRLEGIERLWKLWNRPLPTDSPRSRH